MAKLSAAEQKLLKRGFDYATDSSGYEPAWDDDAVLDYLTANPNESIMTKVAREINLPVHRVITARNRLEKAGKLPKVETITDFIKKQQSENLINYSFKTSENLIVEKPPSDRSQKQLVTVITLWQPWATFIVKGIKCFETRSWIPNYKGRILIHASSRKLNWLEVPLIALEKYCPDLEEWDYPLGAIVGEAELINCHRSEAVRDKLSPLERLCGDYSDGRYAWELTSVKPLFIPNVKGHQKLWKYELNRSQQQSVVTTIVTTTSPLEQEPPRLIDSNGQLSLFYDTSDEAPDPDDFPSDEAYEAAWDAWAEQHPELAAEFNQKAIAPVKISVAFQDVGTIETAEPPTEQPLETTEAVNQALNGESPNVEDSSKTAGDTNFSTGDRVQKKSNPVWVGEIKSISKKGLTVRFCTGFQSTYQSDELTLFSEDKSFFKVGDCVRSIMSGFDNKTYTVKKIHPTGMISVEGKDNQTFSFPSPYLLHYVKKIEPSKKSIPVEQEKPKKKRPPKGCGSGYLRVREANKKRNAEKGKPADIYFVYYYSYSNQYGKEIKGSISVPRAKVSQIKKMIENKEHYVKICKFLGRDEICWY